MSEESGLLSRRNMVLAGAAALGAVGAIAAQPSMSRRVFKPGPVGSSDRPGSTFKRTPPLGAIDNWSAAVGTDFFIRTASGSLLTTLASVAAFPSRGKRPAELARQEAFLLSFDTGRIAAPAGEGIYTVTHRSLGEMQIFLSASATSATGLTAVFN
ncbi:MAG TPA: hypothetical protein VF628_05375 [Allosphingosinicella sp.]|jgi:hypothetical protein